MMVHVITLPYFSRPEVDRYLKIIDWMAAYPRPVCDYRFLLASSPQTEPDPELEQACRRLAPTVTLRCPTQVFGYPQGPTAMFWDAMDYIAENWGDEPGFSLWLESDMIPADERWLDQLTAIWDSQPDPILMGCYVPPVYKRRLLRRWKFMLDEHMNGGACYSKKLAELLPDSARHGVFDMAVFPQAKSIGSVISTTGIAFSTLASARRDMLDSNKFLLHGFMQDKDRFINRCTQPITAREQLNQRFIPALNRVDNFKRHCRVWFFRFGYEAMFENMMLTKHQQENRKKAA